ncbi:GNAT family N-acetyltransferase [Streptosporangium vulgare]|uniref:GNAT family N-acetyltransferase n=1 Tax=Streptosporangium vulgare TaxID=46190 RepID=A0ABV5TPL8_9ACTN
MISRAAYRVVQEALTNVRKHAPGARRPALPPRGGEHRDPRHRAHRARRSVAGGQRIADGADRPAAPGVPARRHPAERALRADPAAWRPGLSWLAQAPDGTVAGFALLTRCHVGDVPALALGPCAVLPGHQRRGAGSAAIRAALRAARDQGENLVLVLGHAEYYPRFGFTPASGHAIRPPFDVSDEHMMALVLDPARPVPSGVIRYPAAFGV